MTHRFSQLRFLKAENDNYSGEKTAEYIDENYNPWLVSAYVWSTQMFGQGVILNEYASTHGDSLGVFIVTQYFINGWPGGGEANNDLRGIRGQFGLQYRRG